MRGKSENTVRVSHREAVAIARKMATPEFLAAFDAMTDEDIAAQIASNPDAAPELDDAWFERARLVLPLKGRKPVSAIAVRFDDTQMWVDLSDGRTLGIPLAWYPRLLSGSPAEREKFFLSPSGIHWEELDEDISIAGLLAGRRDMTGRRKRAA